MFTPTQWGSAGDKEKFLKHFWRFRRSGYKKSLFYKWFYIQLSMMFGHIAHYNQYGFFEEKFNNSQKIAEFEQNIRTWVIYGDPAFTYSDVAREIQQTLNARLGIMS